MHLFVCRRGKHTHVKIEKQPSDDKLSGSELKILDDILFNIFNDILNGHLFDS